MNSSDNTPDNADEILFDDLDRQIQQALLSTPTPDKLKASLLSALQAEAESAAQQSRDEMVQEFPAVSVPFASPSRLLTAWLLPLAAVLALLVALLYQNKQRPAQLASTEMSTDGLCKAMCEFCCRGGLSQPAYASGDIDDINKWLAKNSAPTVCCDQPILSNFKFAGCTVGEWNGEKVSVVCMKDKDGQMVCIAVSDQVLAGATTDEPSHGYKAETWVNDGHTYALISRPKAGHDHGPQAWYRRPTLPLPI